MPSGHAVPVAGSGFNSLFEMHVEIRREACVSPSVVSILCLRCVREGDNQMGHFFRAVLLFQFSV